MWWDSLSNLQQTSFIIATVATVLMIIFIIMMLMGMDGADSFDGDVDFDMDVGGDVDFDTDVDFNAADGAVDVYNNDPIISISGLRIVTVRGALAFFSIGGWVVFLLADTMQIWLAIVLGFIAGGIAAILLAITMKAVMRLESSGNLDYRTAIGKTAAVYIRVPKNSLGKGKVIFNHQGRMVEVDAINRGTEDLTTKTVVSIIGLENETTLIVKLLEEEK
ncbi:MAG: hypothetical protein JEZ05_03250 [Tenericutes bacterium]|nr:hypothetical protein [Mycoplasmatota bacterium]